MPADIVACVAKLARRTALRERRLSACGFESRRKHLSCLNSREIVKVIIFRPLAHSVKSAALIKRRCREQSPGGRLCWAGVYGLSYQENLHIRIFVQHKV